MKTWITHKGTRITRILPGRSNVFMIETGGKRILVDTSAAFTRKMLHRRLRKTGVSTLDFLILTHTHFDHCGNAEYIRTLTGAKICVHPAEAEFLAKGSGPLPAGTVWLTRTLLRIPLPSGAAFFKTSPCKPDFLTENNRLPEGFPTNIGIIHTPGHSPGSLCVTVDNEIALTGDTLFGVFPGNCFPPFADDTKTLIKSWEILLQTDCRLFLPSHGMARPRKTLERSYKKYSRN
jgi:glyoxylase-like metal-dependent hydrolase (beta-lactamase superfamily II)